MFVSFVNKIKTVWFFTFTGFKFILSKFTVTDFENWTRPRGGGAVDFVVVVNVVDVVAVDCGAVVKVEVVLVAVVVLLFVDSVVTVDSVVSLPLNAYID